MRQLSLFAIPVQPRYIKPEPLEIYDAVVKLRRDGLLVFRLGRDKHLVRNSPTGRARRLSTRELLALAENDFWVTGRAQ